MMLSGGLLVAGLILIGIAVRSLHTGRVTNYWSGVETPAGPIYWVIVVALVVLGMANLLAGLYGVIRRIAG